MPFVWTTDVRLLGDGVRGMRPPATLVEKMPLWLFNGVKAEVEAMLIERPIEWIDQKAVEKKNSSGLVSEQSTNLMRADYLFRYSRNLKSLN